MNEFEQFVNELKELPKINEQFVYESDAVTQAMAIGSYGKDKETAENELMQKCRELIKNKKAWIRLLPYVCYNAETDEWLGIARIAVTDGMNDFRCSQCKKLLGKIEGKAEIQCPRCKTINRGMTISCTWQEECKDGPPYGIRIPVSNVIRGVIR